MKFDDNSVVDICGRGTVLFTFHTKEHRALTRVYYIPRPRSNIISIGQLDENGCQTLIENGTMWLRDQQRQLLAKVKRSINHMYVLDLVLAQPVCLAASCGEDAWRWHTRYGHLNF